MIANEILYAPLGEYNIHDGFRIDGSQVRFWATRKSASDAAKAIGWPVKSVMKVHTRFQIGYAIVETRFGALSRDGYGFLYHDRNHEGD